MMRILKALAIAFSTYSRVPMPQFEWKREDMEYTLCFFPWVGVLIGGCVYLWCLVCDLFGIGALCRVLMAAAIPLFLTGGFHVDGFMDTMDAFHSYQSREKKMEILKDSHIGAFAVIRFASYGLVWLAAFSEIRETKILGIVCMGFALSRCLSGISVVVFPKAKREGSLNLFVDRARKGVVLAALALESAFCVGIMFYLSPVGGAAVSGAAFLAMGDCYRKCRRELGGITGDTAGYFVLICEESMLAAAAMVSLVSRIT